MIKKFIKNSGLKIVSIFLMFSFFYVSSFQLVEALDSPFVFDVPHTDATIAGHAATQAELMIGNTSAANTSAQSTVTSASTFADKLTGYWMKFKESVLDPIAWMAAKYALRMITDQTVKWINNDFNGKPGFLTNPKQFGQDVFDVAVGEFLAGNGLDWLCSPFSLQIRLALATSGGGGYRPPKCKLTTMISNAKNFVGNNGGIGWDNFISMTTIPENNPYGAFLTAQNQMSIKLSGSVNKELAHLDWGKGFFGIKRCTQYLPQACLDDFSVGGNMGTKAASKPGPALAFLDNKKNTTTFKTSSNVNRNTASALNSMSSFSISNNILVAVNTRERDGQDLMNEEEAAKTKAATDAAAAETAANKKYVEENPLAEGLFDETPTKKQAWPGMTDAQFNEMKARQDAEDEWWKNNVGTNIDPVTFDSDGKIVPKTAEQQAAAIPGARPCSNPAPKECAPGMEITETPGAAIFGRIDRTFNTDLVKLGVADEFNEIVSALMNYMFRQGASTLLGLGKKDSSGMTRVEYINKIMTDMDKQQVEKVQVDYANDIQNYTAMSQAAVNSANQAATNYLNGQNNQNSSGTNYALGRAASQSSTEGNSVASLAVDGNTSGITELNSIAVTNSENNPWWRVDLGQTYFINKIKIWKATDVSSDEALGHFKVTIFDQDDKVVWISNEINAIDLQDNTLSVASYNYGGGNLVASEATEIPGRYVKIQRIEGVFKKLQLAEVQVFGRPANITTGTKSLTSLSLTKDNTSNTAPFEQTIKISANGYLSSLKVSVSLLKKSQSSVATYYQDSNLSSIFNTLSLGVKNKGNDSITLPATTLNLSSATAEVPTSFAMNATINYETIISGQIKGSNQVTAGDYLLKAQIRNSSGDIISSVDTPISIAE